MKQEETFLLAVVRSAFLGALLFVVLPMLNQIPVQELLKRAGVGLITGSIVGVFVSAIGRRFRRKERDAIAQMQENKN